MTLTLELTPEEEAQIAQEAARAGMSIDTYVLKLLMQRRETPADRVRRLAQEVAGPGHVADLSRDSIYAE